MAQGSGWPGSCPADRREAGPRIKRVWSLTPGNQGLRHLLQLCSRRPTLCHRQLSEYPTQPDQVILGDSSRLLERTGWQSRFRGHLARRLCPRKASLSEEGTQLERIR